MKSFKPTLLGALAGAAMAACGGNAGPPPNVLLITLDSTRRDLLGAYGHSSPLAPGVSPSPHIDRLAAEGVLVQEAYSTTSWTLPAHVSLLSGEPELVHAVDIDTHRPDPLRPFLSQILRQRGYRTAGFASGPYLEAGFGFARGFDRYETRYGPELAAASAAAQETARALNAAKLAGADAQAERKADSEARARLDHAAHEDHSSARVSDAVVEELERAARDGQPFFVFAHYFDPHYDYVPPAELARRFDPDYGGTITGERFFTNPLISTFDPERPDRRLRVVSERDLEHVRALYAAELAATDAEIGRVLDTLERLGLAQNTLVVVTADHGDEFFEHGGIGHRTTLYEELVRVPLILRLPGRLPAGEHVSGPVSLVDVAPTVLDLVGIAPPESLGSTSFLRRIGGEHAAGEPPAPGVLGRLATNLLTRLEVPRQDDPTGEISGLTITLLETFRRGPIKVTRSVSWSRPRASVSPPTLRALQAQAERQRAQEELRWIDVERFPDERDEDHSTDFSDPRALAALRAFHDRYVVLLQRRGHADLAAADEDELAQLQALGYVGAGGERPVIASDEFTLPPPGRALLSE